MYFFEDYYNTAYTFIKEHWICFIILILLVSFLVFFWKKKEILNFYYDKNRPHIYYIIIYRMTLPLLCSLGLFTFLIIVLGLGMCLTSINPDLFMLDLLFNYVLIYGMSSEGLWDIVFIGNSPGSGSGSGWGGPSGSGGNPQPGGNNPQPWGWGWGSQHGGSSSQHGGNNYQHEGNNYQQSEILRAVQAQEALRAAQEAEAEALRVAQEAEALRAAQEALRVAQAAQAFQAAQTAGRIARAVQAQEALRALRAAEAIPEVWRATEPVGSPDGPPVGHVGPRPINGYNDFLDISKWGDEYEWNKEWDLRILNKLDRQKRFLRTLPMTSKGYAHREIFCVDFPDSCSFTSNERAWIFTRLEKAPGMYKIIYQGEEKWVIIRIGSSGMDSSAHRILDTQKFRSIFPCY